MNRTHSPYTSCQGAAAVAAIDVLCRREARAFIVLSSDIPAFPFVLTNIYELFVVSRTRRELLVRNYCAWCWIIVALVLTLYVLLQNSEFLRLRNTRWEQDCCRSSLKTTGKLSLYDNFNRDFVEYRQVSFYGLACVEVFQSLRLFRSDHRLNEAISNEKLV